jgi:hypothetical protein
MPSSAKMRLFFGTDAEQFQLLSVAQNADGSIYFSAPMFQNIEWRLPVVGADREPVLVSYQVSEQGKLSVHGSGVVHVKAHEAAGSNEFAIRGNILKSKDGETLSVRHLLTIFPSEPQHKPNSPPGARKTDGVMTTKQWHPYAVVFWAVPLTRSLTITITGSFQADELEEVPPNGGWGAFSLATHALVWFAYRTKHMQRWPKKSQACYADGYLVPLFIGTGLGEFRLEYRQPHYSLDEGRLGISL